MTNRCLPISIYEYSPSPAQVPSRVNQAARLHIGIERCRPSFRSGPRMLFAPQGSVVVIIARQVSDLDWPDGKNLTGLTPLSPAATDNRPAKFFDHRFLLR